ncbi:hypothetical protein CTI14_64670, partial [Methylobacterium radiotolerans]
FDVTYQPFGEPGSGQAGNFSANMTIQENGEERDYDSMNRGRFVADDSFAPYSMRLDSFDVTYQPFGEPGSGQAGNFSANMTIQENGEER